MKNQQNKRRIPVLRAVFSLLLMLAVSLPGSSSSSLIQSPTGTIKGRVLDEEVKSPLPHARIKLKETSFEVFSDTDGCFEIKNVPIGTHVLEISCRFYLTQFKSDIIIKPQRITFVEAALRLDNFVNEEEITVTAGYFPAADGQTAPAASFSNEEIRRAAGSAGDVSRIISGLPSIARVNDLQNNLVVRGGSPAENAFYIDNIEIPNINHYPSLGSSAGAIGMLNVDFIRDVSFYSGGFSPVYGNRLSSIMDIAFREGNREESDFQFDFSMMGIGMVAEGPLLKDKGSWMLSARRSYVDLLIELMGSGVPVSWSDFQGKLTYDLSARHKLTLLGIAGFDDSGTIKEDALKDGESFFGGLDTREYTTGISWTTMWGSRGYSNTSLAFTSTRFLSDAFHTVSEKPARRGNDRERILTLRNVNTFRLGSRHKFSFGAEVKNFLSNYDNFTAAYIDVMGNDVPGSVRKLKMSVNKFAAYGNFFWNPSAALTFSLGTRADHYTYNQSTHLSPRLSLSWQISSKTSLNGAAGIFRQSLPLILLSQNPDHRKLKDPFAYHFIVGFRRLLSENTRLSIELYDKEYQNFPLDPHQPRLFIFDEIFYNGSFSEHPILIDTGRAQSYGIEFLIQKKMKDKLYGILSAAYFRTRYRDLDGTWRNRVYDNRFILAVEGGYKLSGQWELGIKANYAGGAAYTPFDRKASAAVNSGIYDQSRINGKRMPAYFSLNLRVDKRFYFGSSNLIIYLSIWNVLNHKNPIFSYWNTIDNRPDMAYSWGLLPALGIEFEF